MGESVLMNTAIKKIRLMKKKRGELGKLFPYF